MPEREKFVSANELALDQMENVSGGTNFREEYSRYGIVNDGKRFYYRGREVTPQEVDELFKRNIF